MAFHATGEDRLGELATTGNGEARRWIEKLARRESPLLHAQVITPCQAAEDIVARIWIDHFKRERQRLEKDDGEQGLRRLTLTKIIKQLAQQTAWPLRSAALIGELPVDGESPTPPPPV